MASAFSHAFVAVASGYTLIEKPRSLRFWFLSVACSILPDFDVIAFAFGIPYEHPLGHRGLSHSLAFAALLAASVTYLGFRGIEAARVPWLLAHFFLITASHGFLDAMTDGGLGIAFFAPFDNGRYFLPWRPIPVSPIGIGAFFSSWGLEIMIAEFFWIWIPAALPPLVAAAWRRRKKPAEST